MLRSSTTYDGKTGELIETVSVNATWDDVRGERDMWLSNTDNWYWADRWATLDVDKQTELNAFRQAWRDITDYFDAEDEVSQGANAAADNAPVCPEWARDWEVTHDGA